ncbi:MAG: hypothetical protein ACRDTG_16445 [Pseudonocardiaceae bacterium]
MAPAYEHANYSSMSGDSEEWRRERAAEQDTALRELASLDLATADGWDKARLLSRRHRGPLDFNAIVDHAATTPPARLANVLAGFLSHPGFSLWEYRTVIERFAALPLLPHAARAQLRHLVTQATARFCLDLSTKQHNYANLPELAGTIGVNRDLQRDAFAHVGSLSAPLTSTQCFELATVLAQRLTSGSARIALDDLSTLLLPLASDDSADGDFNSIPAVPATAAECIAGYLWTALGDPATDIRWRTAHTMRLLVELGRSDVLDALRRFPSGDLNAAPFTDAQLPFYDKHALLWLLLAIARAAHESETAPELRAFVPLLERVAFKDPPHVLLRAAAASALIGLAAAGVDDVTESIAEHARTVNIPIAVLPVDLADVAPDEDEEDDESKPTVRFFMDFADYWCDDVADAFGLSNNNVARRASDIVAEVWRLPHVDGRINDPRATRGLYDGQKTNLYKSSWPEVETFNFYLATHALWTVAGTLVDTQPVYQKPYSDLDEFTGWLRRLLPERDDGRWLADRRDPSPTSIFTNRHERIDASWIWTLSRSDFAERLSTGDWITVWERSSDSTDTAQQKVHVHSAQVRPDRARALVLALQTAPSSMAWNIPESPDSEEDRRPTIPGFDLTGWISTHHQIDGFDNRDPLGTSIPYPPPHPDDATRQLLGLVPDADMRTWTRSDQRPAFRSRVWRDLYDTSRGRRHSGGEGDRLEIHRDALTDLLTKTGNSLIVIVTIERTHEETRPTHLYSGDNDDLAFLEPSFNVYLIDETGRTSQL